MARENNWDRPTLRQPPPTPVAEPEIHMPREPVPNEVSEWLSNMGWMDVSDGDGNQLFQKQDCWGGYYYTWSEAIALEHMKFMSLGNLGKKERKSSGEDVTNSAQVANPGVAKAYKC